MTLRLVALFVMLCCVVLRVVVAYDPFPGWMDDPTQLPWVASTIGPTTSVAIDLVLMLAASIVAGASLFERGECCKWRVRVWRWMLTGAIGVVLHAWWSGWDVDRITIGVQWTAAMLAGAAVYIASHDPLCRRLMAGVLLGCVGLVACRAGVQYLVENPLTYADFKANKASILAAHGWTEDSPLSKSFERRVSQPDAGGWFGLSNVLGSFAAGSLVALGTLAALAWRANREVGVNRFRDAMLVGAGVLAASATLAFSMSKGAIIAAVCGVVLTCLARGTSEKTSKRKRGALIGLACIAGPIAGVLVRGLIGDGLGELSIRFRAFYFEGAWNALSDAGRLFGIGPGSFQDAYTSSKPALSPENVSSTHNFIVDHVVALGLLGLEWFGAVLLFAVNCGRMLGSSRGSEQVHEQSLERSEMRYLVAIGAIVTLLGAVVEREVATPLSTGVRLGGLFLFAIIAIGVTSIANAKPKVASIAIAAGALTALIHAQIDMVGTSPGSAAWFFALLGLGAGGALSRVDDVERSDIADVASVPKGKARTPFQRRVIASVPMASVLLLIGLMTPGLIRLWKWERFITEAAEVVRPLAMARVLATNASLGTDAQRLREAAEVLSAALGQRVESNPRSIDAAMTAGRRAFGQRAIELMLSASGEQPRHLGTNRAASELLLSQGVFSKSNGDVEAGRALMARSREVMEAYVSRVGIKAGAWAWLGLVCRTISEESGDLAARDRAIQAYERAAVSDPCGPINIPPLVELLVQAGRTGDACRWAREGLARHDLTRLDPLAGLSERQLARLRQLAEAP